MHEHGRQQPADLDMTGTLMTLPGEQHPALRGPQRVRNRLLMRRPDLLRLLRAQGNSLSYGSDEQKAAYAQAEQNFRKATHLNEKYAEAFTGLGWILQDQANLSGDAKQYQESVDVLKQSLALQETQSSAHNALGWSYRGLEQYDDAEQAFRRATELDEHYADAFYGLGRTLEDLGRKDEAREAYKSALDNGNVDAQGALDALK